MSTRLVWLAPALTAACVGTFTAFASEGEPGLDLLFGAAFVAFGTVGALIVTRHPRNPIGWLFCAVGLSSAASEALYAYARSALADGAPEPATAVAAGWVAAWTSGPSFVAAVLLLLLFPSGRFLSPRWRRLGIAAVAWAALWALTAAFDPGPLRTVETVSNPLGIAGAGAVLGPIADLGALGLALATLAALFSVVLRFRGARSEERQQIKWLALAAGFDAGLVLIQIALIAAVDTDEGVWDLVTSLTVGVGVLAFPLAAGVAILRHRLYDIDVVINRTLVYAALSATLAGAYLGGVLVLGLVVRPLTGSSNLAIAGSTLAVAALFGPARARIQRVVDRRFYRRRYDAARTLESFGARLRDEVDLDALGADLRHVVVETMAPAHVSLWLREASR